MGGGHTPGCNVSVKKVPILIYRNKICPDYMSQKMIQQKDGRSANTTLTPPFFSCPPTCGPEHDDDITQKCCRSALQRRPRKTTDHTLI